MSSGSREPMTLLRVASLMRFYERTLRDVIYKSQAPSVSTNASGGGVSDRAEGAYEATEAAMDEEQAGPALAMAVTVSVLSHLKELEALAFQVAISALNILSTKCLEKVTPLYSLIEHLQSTVYLNLYM